MPSNSASPCIYIQLSHTILLYIQVKNVIFLPFSSLLNGMEYFPLNLPYVITVVQVELNNYIPS